MTTPTQPSPAAVAAAREIGPKLNLVDAAQLALKIDKHFATLQAENRELREACENLLNDDSPYPLDETAKALVEAVQILLHEKNYDGHMHERFSIAMNNAKMISFAVRFVRKALLPKSPTPPTE